MTIRGKAHKYGENIDTDAILPGRYLNLSSAEELGKHCMENLDPEFRNRVKEGDLIVARKNYGCGSSREHAPVAIKANGIACVIADSFARIFFRNSINLALPLVDCAEVAAITETGDELEVDLEKGTVTNKTKGQSFSFKSYPESMMKIVDAGGLIEYTRKTM
jgi:3-isopropylmalate/(R)-2-methylmalate dehydratase small subunit